MRRIFASAAAAVVTITGLACATPAAEIAPAAPSVPAREDPPVNETDRVPGQYLVTLDAGANPSAITDVYGRFGIKRVQDLGRGVYLVTLSDDPGPKSMDETRKGDARIKAIQPNYVYRGNR